MFTQQSFRQPAVVCVSIDCVCVCVKNLMWVVWGVCGGVCVEGVLCV